MPLSLSQLLTRSPSRRTAEDDFARGCRRIERRSAAVGDACAKDASFVLEEEWRARLGGAAVLADDEDGDGVELLRRGRCLGRWPRTALLRDLGAAIGAR